PFFVFAYLGIARSFNMTETSLIVRDVLWFRKKALPLSQIEKVTYNEKSIEIFSSEFKEGSKVFLMKKKTIPLFLEALKVKKPELKVAEDHSLGLHKKEEKNKSES
ncbi:EbsA family protein, partial [Enterococcus faecalis]|nr:EbsA family protein [Enterococcus faecalis]